MYRVVKYHRTCLGYRLLPKSYPHESGRSETRLSVRLPYEKSARSVRLPVYLPDRPDDPCDDT